MANDRPDRSRPQRPDSPQAYLWQSTMRMMAGNQAGRMDSPVARITLPGAVRTVSPIDLLLLARKVERHGGKA